MRTARGARLLAAGVTLLAWFVVAWFRTLPDMSPPVVAVPPVAGEDWDAYEAMARAIISGSLGGDPSLGYSSSFTYPYFVAGVHWVLGPSMQPLYAFQHLTLAVACLLLALYACHLWGERAGLAVLVVANGVAILDVARWYAMRALSENLALVMIPAVLLALRWWQARPSALRGLLAGGLLALGVLTRFNWLPFAGLALAYLIVYWRPTPQEALAAALEDSE